MSNTHKALKIMMKLEKTMTQNWTHGWFRAQLHHYPIEMLLHSNRPMCREAQPGERVIGNFILPPFQRGAVWSRTQKIKLIESFVDEFPIPPYVVNRDLSDGYAYDRWLIDGQQRVTAILDFIDNDFAVYGVTFPTASDVDKRWFLQRPFSCLETNLTDEKALKKIYDRLAYGGTPHQPQGNL